MRCLYDYYMIGSPFCQPGRAGGPAHLHVITMRLLCDYCAITVRLLCDYCAITVRLLCDYCAITVRLLYDYYMITMQFLCDYYAVGSHYWQAGRAGRLALRIGM